MIQEKLSNLPIKKWSDNDQPRAKLKIKGPEVLSDAELLAILIGSGTKSMTAVDLCRQICQKIDDDLDRLGRMTIKELMQFRGIGEAKAITVLAAMELGRRRELHGGKLKKQILDSRSAYEAIAPNLVDKRQEELWVLYLNQGKRLMDRSRIATGGVDSTLVDPRLVFGKALELLASSIILCHNHPSGTCKPSMFDQKITRKVSQAGKLLDIELLDHIIVAGRQYFSFADEGLL